MSIECTTSANSTVTCLYSADVAAGLTGAPHSLQNLDFGGSSVPHDPHNSPAAVTAPRPSPVPSTSVSCHRWSAMSVISPCHLRHEVLRRSYLVYFATVNRHPGMSGDSTSWERWRHGRWFNEEVSACLTAASNLKSVGSHQ